MSRVFLVVLLRHLRHERCKCQAIKTIATTQQMCSVQNSIQNIQARCAVCPFMAVGFYFTLPVRIIIAPHTHSAHTIERAKKSLVKCSLFNRLKVESHKKSILFFNSKQQQQNEQKKNWVELLTTTIPIYRTKNTHWKSLQKKMLSPALRSNTSSD